MSSSRLSRGAALVAAALLALSMAPSARASNCNPALAGGPGRPMPMVGARPVAVPPRALLRYFGGRVISNVQVVMVLWGPGEYAPFVTGAESPSLASFFAGVTNSPYLDGLSQYDTTRAAAGGSTGTNQRIGRGRFVAQIQIAPAARKNESLVDDKDIIAELAVQLDAGKLPPPAMDADGHVETLYVLYFPAGKSVTLGGQKSCETMCAYHGSFAWVGRNVYYAVMPDMSAGSGCDVGCGTDTPFRNATSVASHELAETITDPEVGLATGVGPPLGWYDPTNGEIGDICAGLSGTVAGGDGAEYLVQKLWSNADEACVVSPGPGAVALRKDARETMPASALARTTSDQGSSPALARARILSLQPPEAAAALSGPGTSRVTPAALRATGRSDLKVLQSEPARIPEGAGSRFTIEEENDALAFGRHHTDEFYTQGLRISTRWASGSRLTSSGQERLGVAIGQNIYTPSDIRLTDLETLRHDRPYAGWLYAALLWELALDSAPLSLRAGADAYGPGASEFGIDVAVGTTGPRSGADAVQTNFHRLLRDLSGNAASPPDPAGWSIYQTANRFTVDFAFRYQFDLLRASAGLGEFTSWSGSVLALRLSPRARVDAGAMFDAAGLGLELRTGLMAAARQAERPSVPFELYGFARADGRRVAYNGFIQGILRDQVTPLVSIARRVGELSVGLVTRVGGLELAVANLWRTSELEPVPSSSSRIHRVGQFRVSLVY